ncbi:MAG: sugar ABC transporter permease [Clostridia bacterium]|nr:sugar ABC transporter permease [Clostridia bacterium]
MNKRQLSKYFPIFVLPTIAAFGIGFIYPFLHGIYLSFCSFKTTSDAAWVGVDNYIDALGDRSFLYSFWFTAAFTVVSVTLINLLAFAVAYVLTSGIRGANAFRTVFFMPNLIGGVILGYIWQLIFNGILQSYGTNIKLNSTFGFWGLVILLCWQQIGYMMIIYISGLNSIPESLYEAAKVDGATKWQTLRKVTLPMMMPSITICTFLTLTNSFKLFDQNLALTAGEPGLQVGGETIYQTEMLALNIYNTFYQNANTRGVGQAKAVLFFLLVAVIGLVQLYLTRKKEVQQ